MHSATKIFFLAIFGMALGATVVKPEVENTNPFPHFETDEVFTCGGVIREASEQILYKPFRQVDANERCVWIVAAPQATSYRVKLHHAGFSERLLNVAGISQGSDGLNNVDLTTSAWTTVTGSLLAITFHTSNETSSTGFALEYEVYGTGSVISPNSVHQLVDADTLFIKFPEGRTNYDNYELSVFALPPLNNVQVEGGSRQVIFQRLGLEQCYDKLTVYQFIPTINRYSANGSLCDTANVELIKSNDASLLIFRSDYSIVSTGFNLAFTSCSG